MNRVKNVLLVDDNDADNYVHKRVIEESGCSARIVVKENGKLAIEYIENELDGSDESPWIVFLDLNMPVMDGWQFLDRFAALPNPARSEIRVVILSASGNPDDKNRADRMPEVSSFVPKPLTANELVAILKSNT